MTPLPRSRKWRTALAWLSVWFLGLGVGVFWFWADISGYVEWKYQQTLHASTSREGVRKDLASGRFRPGDSVDDLIAAYPPEYTHGGPRYLQLSYPKAGSTEFASVVAKDGRLALAWMNGPDEGMFELFNTLTPAEYAAFMAELQAERDRVGDARMAVAGPAATISP